MSNIIHPNKKLVKISNIKVIFLGTPQFAVPILEKLAQSEYKPVAVFCAPDKPIGRKQILTPPPVKITAQKYNIPVFQPADVSSFKLQALKLNPDLIITAAFSLILPQTILDAPEYGCLNIHPSLLPKYRGPSPIQNAILAGDQETGVAIIKMTEKVDAGPIIASYKLQVTSYKITTPQLSEELSRLGAKLLINTLPDWLAGKIPTEPQDETKATFTKILRKENGEIDWGKPAEYIERQTRAYNPWPGTFTELKNTPLSSLRSRSSGRSNPVINTRIKILEADISPESPHKKIGKFFITADGELAVQTGNGCLIIKTIQPEGKKPMTGQEFLRGHKNIFNKE